MLSVREEIAKNLLYYRKKAGFTQKQLADMIGVKNTAVSNWESGNNSIDIDTLCRVCDIYGVTLNDMYGGYSDRAPALNAEERELISVYRGISKQGREYLLQTLDMVSRIYKNNDNFSEVENAI